MITMRVEANWDRESPKTRIRAGLHTEKTGNGIAAADDGDAESGLFQHLLSALAGCLIGMGKLVAKEQGLALDGISCRVEGDMNASGPASREIRLQVTVRSDEDDSRLAAWMAEVEKRCPIRDDIVSAMPTMVFMKN